MVFDYRKAKHGGTEKEILAYEAKHSPKSKALDKKKGKVEVTPRLHSGSVKNPFYRTK